MYERNAIILERYFENFFGFNKPSNLIQNYKNYCELFEKFSNFQSANNQEFATLEEFKAIEVDIENIQIEEDKLYKQNAKFEYNRDFVFSDITQDPDEIQRCMDKLQGDIGKNYDAIVELGNNFVTSVRNYNNKKEELANCKKNRKNAEAEYNAIFEVTKKNIENIPEEYITIAKEFDAENNQDELVETMLENGKEEKIPFNNSVIRSAVKIAFDIQKRFIDTYIEVYNKTNKLISELIEGAVSVELHEKTLRNIKVKLEFLTAEKDYLIQFLDYERIMVIHGKRMHRNLMIEACENFDIDIAQINNLYELLMKEIAGKSTKKAYKELYNKSYLIDIEDNDEKFKKERNKISLSTATIMNTNYWRIEGIKNIYTVFYKDVVEVFGRALDEFEVPKDPDEVENEEAVSQNVIAVEEIAPEVEENQVEVIETIEGAEELVEEIEVQAEKPQTPIIEAVSEDAPALPGMAEALEENESFMDIFDEIELDEEKPVEKVKKVKRYTRKKVAKENIAAATVLEKAEETVPATQENYNDLFDETEAEPDIFGAKYKDMEAAEELDIFDDIELEEPAIVNNAVNINEEDIPYEDEAIPFEDESIFNNIENANYDELNLIKEDKVEEKPKKMGILRSLIKLNSKDKKKVAAN